MATLTEDGDRLRSEAGAECLKYLSKWETDDLLDLQTLLVALMKNPTATMAALVSQPKIAQVVATLAAQSGIMAVSVIVESRLLAETT